MEFKQNQIEEHYEIGTEIGSGQFAVVKKAKHSATGEEVAAKFIRKKRSKASRRGVSLDVIQREVTILQDIQHDNIVKLLEVYEDKQDVILLMELVSGGELFEYLAEKEKVSEDEAVVFLKQILDGLQYMHQKDMVHLDLKPENLMLLNHNSKRLKIIDFGLSRYLHGNQECRELLGTPEFVAPEVINYDPLCKATDMWSIGVITYILLSGCSPFLGDDKQETLSNISAMRYDFDNEHFVTTSELAMNFIRSLLVKDPRYRATVHDALSHPWITPIDSTQVRYRRSSSINLDNLKNFVARNKWKRKSSREEQGEELTPRDSDSYAADSLDDTRFSDDVFADLTTSSASSDPAAGVTSATSPRSPASPITERILRRHSRNSGDPTHDVVKPPSTPPTSPQSPPTDRILRRHSRNSGDRPSLTGQHSVVQDTVAEESDGSSSDKQERTRSTSKESSGRRRRDKSESPPPPRSFIRRRRDRSDSPVSANAETFDDNDNKVSSNAFDDSSSCISERVPESVDSNEMIVNDDDNWSTRSLQSEDMHDEEGKENGLSDSNRNASTDTGSGSSRERIRSRRPISGQSSVETGSAGRVRLRRNISEQSESNTEKLKIERNTSPSDKGSIERAQNRTSQASRPRFRRNPPEQQPVDSSAVSQPSPGRDRRSFQSNSPESSSGRARRAVEDNSTERTTPGRVRTSVRNKSPDEMPSGRRRRSAENNSPDGTSASLGRMSTDRVRRAAQTNSPNRLSTGRVRRTAQNKSPDGTSTGRVRRSAQNNSPDGTSTGRGRRSAQNNSPDGTSTGRVRRSAQNNSPDGTSTGRVRRSAQNNSPDGTSTGRVRRSAQNNSPDGSPGRARKPADSASSGPTSQRARTSVQAHSSGPTPSGRTQNSLDSNSRDRPSSGRVRMRQSTTETQSTTERTRLRRNISEDTPAQMSPSTRPRFRRSQTESNTKNQDTTSDATSGPIQRTAPRRRYQDPEITEQDSNDSKQPENDLVSQAAESESVERKEDEDEEKTSGSVSSEGDRLTESTDDQMSVRTEDVEDVDHDDVVAGDSEKRNVKETTQIEESGEAGDPHEVNDTNEVANESEEETAQRCTEKKRIDDTDEEETRGSSQAHSSKDVKEDSGRSYSEQRSDPPSSFNERRRYSQPKTNSSKDELLRSPMFARKRGSVQGRLQTSDNSERLVGSMREKARARNQLWETRRGSVDANKAEPPPARIESAKLKQTKGVTSKVKRFQHAAEDSTEDKVKVDKTKSGAPGSMRLRGKAAVFNSNEGIVATKSSLPAEKMERRLKSDFKRDHSDTEKEKVETKSRDKTDIKPIKSVFLQENRDGDKMWPSSTDSTPSSSRKNSISSDKARPDIKHIKSMLERKKIGEIDANQKTPEQRRGSVKSVFLQGGGNTTAAISSTESPDEVARKANIHKELENLTPLSIRVPHEKVTTPLHGKSKDNQVTALHSHNKTNSTHEQSSTSHKVWERKSSVDRFEQNLVENNEPAISLDNDAGRRKESLTLHSTERRISRDSNSNQVHKTEIQLEVSGTEAPMVQLWLGVQDPDSASTQIQVKSRRQSEDTSQQMSVRPKVFAVEPQVAESQTRDNDRQRSRFISHKASKSDSHVHAPYGASDWHSSRHRSVTDATTPSAARQKSEATEYKPRAKINPSQAVKPEVPTTEPQVVEFQLQFHGHTRTSSSGVSEASETLSSLDSAEPEAEGFFCAAAKIMPPRQAQRSRLVSHDGVSQEKVLVQDNAHDSSFSRAIDATDSAKTSLLLMQQRKSSTNRDAIEGTAAVPKTNTYMTPPRKLSIPEEGSEAHFTDGRTDVRRKEAVTVLTGALSKVLVPGKAPRKSAEESPSAHTNNGEKPQSGSSKKSGGAKFIFNDL